MSMARMAPDSPLTASDRCRIKRWVSAATPYLSPATYPRKKALPIAAVLWEINLVSILCSRNLWLTSPAFEILDVTFAMNLGWATNREECAHLIVYQSAHEPPGDSIYHPTLVGPDVFSQDRRRAVKPMRSRVFISMIAYVCVANLAAGDSPTFDPKPWLGDLAQTREALATKYANLEWVVPEREMDLESLFNDAKKQLQSATTDTDARGIFDRLARRLGDGHVRFRWTTDSDAKPTPKANCAALGYDSAIRGKQVAALIPGYSPISEAPAKEFPAGTLHVAGHTVGVIKLGIFTPDGMPELCAESLLALKLSANTPCGDTCKDRIGNWVADRMTRDLAAQLQAIVSAKANILLVDVADNGGGTEWAEAAARMVTAVRLKSERIGFVRGPHWEEHFASTIDDLRAAAKSASKKDQNILNGLEEQAREYRREAATPCDSQPLWQGKRLSCNWLGLGFYASGLIDSADPQALKNKPWAKEFFTPMQFPYEEGVWRGPLIVLVNGGTGSAAEEFAALLQDNRAAVIIGAPTAGTGCGHTNGGTPTTLKNSGAVLELPDCARIRADGSNEVVGIQPDVLVGLRSTDGAHRQGVRVLEKLPEAITRSIELRTPSGQHP